MKNFCFLIGLVISLTANAQIFEPKSIFDNPKPEYFQKEICMKKFRCEWQEVALKGKN